jgi:hypothetical protein
MALFSLLLAVTASAGASVDPPTTIPDSNPLRQGGTAGDARGRATVSVTDPTHGGEGLGLAMSHLKPTEPTPKACSFLVLEYRDGVVYNRTYTCPEGPAFTFHFKNKVETNCNGTAINTPLGRTCQTLCYRT